MIGFKFSKLPRHRKFNYTPVFYDEAQDELHERVNEIKREMGEIARDGDSVKNNIRKAYKAKQTSTRFGTAPGASIYGLRVILIAVILGVILFYLWDSNLLEIIFGHLNK
ncbi:MAG: hypothetical protein ACPGYY_01440 [Bacteroidia bacterium]